MITVGASSSCSAPFHLAGRCGTSTAASSASSSATSNSPSSHITSVRCLLPDTSSPLPSPPMTPMPPLPVLQRLHHHILRCLLLQCLLLFRCLLFRCLLFQRILLLLHLLLLLFIRNLLSLLRCLILDLLSVHLGRGFCENLLLVTTLYRYET